MGAGVGLGFVLIGVVTAIVADGPVWRRVLVTTLVAVWGPRLAWHIRRRNRGKPEDRRYVDLLARAKGNPDLYALYSVYLSQGRGHVDRVAARAVRQYGDGTWVVVPFGMALWLVGLGFGAVGDAQPARFTADSANRGKVLKTGLWRYTRHPNYFGDACVWWGFFVLACHDWPRLVTVVGPAAITYLLTRATVNLCSRSRFGPADPTMPNMWRGRADSSPARQKKPDQNDRHSVECR